MRAADPAAHESPQRRALRAVDEGAAPWAGEPDHPGPHTARSAPPARPGPLGAADGPGPGAGDSDREAEPGRDAGPGGGAGPRPRRRPGLRARPELTFVLGHQPLERRPRHRPGNSCAVRPRLRRARILPPEAGAASGSPAGHRGPSGARGARAQWRRAARAVGGRGGAAVPRGPAPGPSAALWGQRRSGSPNSCGAWFPQRTPGSRRPVGAQEPPVPSHWPPERPTEDGPEAGRRPAGWADVILVGVSYRPREG